MIWGQEKPGFHELDIEVREGAKKKRPGMTTDSCGNER